MISFFSPLSTVSPPLFVLDFLFFYRPRLSVQGFGIGRHGARGGVQGTQGACVASFFIASGAWRLSLGIGQAIEGRYAWILDRFLCLD